MNVHFLKAGLLDILFPRRRRPPPDEPPLPPGPPSPPPRPPEPPSPPGRRPPEPPPPPGRRPPEPPSPPGRRPPHGPTPPGRRRAFSNGRGLTRAAAILLVLIFVMLIVTAVPFVKRWREDSAAFNCMLSVEKIQDLLDMEVLFRQRTLSPKETEAFLADCMERGEILCPDGGEFDAVDRDSLSMEVVCCRHDSDGVRKVRLCAERTLERVRKAVLSEQLSGRPFPDKVRVTLNSRPLDAVRVEEATGLRRGTATTAGYKGIVAFYALAGDPSEVNVLALGRAAEEEAETAEGEGDPETEDASPSSETGSAESAPSEGADTQSNQENSQPKNRQPDGEPSGGTDADSGNPLSDSGIGSSDSGDGLSDSGDGPSDGAAAFVPDGEVQPGEVWYFSYADEDHAATWTVGDGWRIDGIRPHR